MTTSGQTHSDTGPPFLPGRLGDPDSSLKTDPRADPRLVAALAKFGLDEAATPGPVTAESPLGEILEFCAAAETGFHGFGGEADGIDPAPVVGNHERYLIARLSCGKA